MKYKVGDIVKLRDDLEFGKYYGGMQLSETFHGGIIGKKGKIKRCASYGYWTMFKGGRVWCDITDEMIEGLWEECKSSEQVSKSEGKYKLIDILNKIANGELKEGTKVKLLSLDNEYILSEYRGLVDEYGKDVFKPYNFYVLNTEVELIEPDHFPDVGKMAHQFREDTKMILELRDKFLLTDDVSESMKIDMMWDKLNEVVRVINKRVLDKGE